MLRRLSIRQLFYLLSSFSIIAAILSAIFLYRYIEQNIRERLDHLSHENAYAVQRRITEYFDTMYYNFQITHDQQTQKMEIAQNYFALHGDDAPLEPLQKMLHEEQSDYDIYLINHDLVVERTTFENDLGLDFNLYSYVPVLMRSLYANPSHIDISPPLHESTRGDFKRYSAQRSNSGRFIIQLGQTLSGDTSHRNFINTLRKTIPTLYTNSVYEIYSSPLEDDPIREIWSTKLQGLKKTEAIKIWTQSGNLKDALIRIDPASTKAFDQPRKLLLPYLKKLFKKEDLIETSYWRNGRYMHLIILPMRSSHHIVNKSYALLIMEFDETDQYYQLQSIKHIMIISILSIIIVFMGIVWIAYKRIISPLNHMQRNISRKKPIEKHYIQNFSDEIATMSRTYNWLLQDLKSEIQSNQDLLNQFKTFTANAIHQVRTPLNVMKISLESIDDTTSSEAKLNLQASVITMEHLYDTLAYSLKEGTLDFDADRIDVEKVLLERVKLFAPLAKAHDMEIVTRLSSDSFTLIHPTELEFLIDNNLSNAIKYGKPSSSVTVKLEEIGNEIVLSFWSHGAPIEKQFDIFKRYTRLDQSKQGSGLGLNIVSAICERRKILIQLDYQNNQNVFRYYFQKIL